MGVGEGLRAESTITAMPLMSNLENAHTSLHLRCSQFIFSISFTLTAEVVGEYVNDWREPHVPSSNLVVTVMGTLSSLECL